MLGWHCSGLDWQDTVIKTNVLIALHLPLLTNIWMSIFKCTSGKALRTFLMRNASHKANVAGVNTVNDAQIKFKFLLVNLLDLHMDRKQIIRKCTDQKRRARFYIWCRGLYHKYKGLACRETFCVDDYNITITLLDYAFGWMWLFLQTC